MQQIQKQQISRESMEMTFKFPREIGQEIQEQANLNEFMVKAAQKALLEQWQEEEIKKGIIEAENGELVSHEEVEKCLAKYIK